VEALFAKGCHKTIQNFNFHKHILKDNWRVAWALYDFLCDRDLLVHMYYAKVQRSTNFQMIISNYNFVEFVHRKRELKMLIIFSTIVLALKP